ncbi:MAG: hypothetical protein ACLTXM_04315 [Enterococcus sp.]
MNEAEACSKQKVMFILPSTVVSSPGSRMFVLSQYREPVNRMQEHFGDSYLVKSNFLDNIKKFDDDTIYLIPEQFRHVVDLEKISKRVIVPSNIFGDKVLEDIRREVAVLQMSRRI